MKKILYYILTCVILSAPCSCYAQLDTTLTEYEKQRGKIAFEALAKIATLYDEYGDRWESLGQQAGIIKLLNDKNITDSQSVWEVIETVEEIISSICGVAWFMPGDNYKDRYYTEKYISICKWYSEQLTELDKSISAADLAHERDKFLKIALTNDIEKQIKKDFRIWNQKKEYEKSTNYEERLRTQSEWAFDSICQSAIKGNWKNKTRYKFGKYDADNEILPLKITYADKNGNELCNVDYNISVNPTFAEEICRPYHNPFSNAFIITEGVYKDFLFPIKFAFRERVNSKDDTLYCYATTEGIKPLAIRFDKFSINNSYLAGTERVASFDRFYTYRQNLQDTINLYNQLIKQNFSSLSMDAKSKMPSIEHSQTIISDCINQRDWKLAEGLVLNKNAIDRFGSHAIERFGRRYYSAYNYNMINLTEDDFDEFLKAIHIFYDESIEALETVREIYEICTEKGVINVCPEKPVIEIRKSYISGNIADFDIIVGYENNYDCNRYSNINFKEYNFLNSQDKFIVAFSKAKMKENQKWYERLCTDIVVREDSKVYNKAAAKEYSKNGIYFSSPVDFINAYVVSGNYKAELKTRKKQN